MGNVALEAKSYDNFVIEYFSEDGIELFTFTQGDEINDSGPVLPITQLENARALRIVKNVDSRSPLCINPDNLRILQETQKKLQILFRLNKIHFDTFWNLQMMLECRTRKRPKLIFQWFKSVLQFDLLDLL